MSSRMEDLLRRCESRNRRLIVGGAGAVSVSATVSGRATTVVTGVAASAIRAAGNGGGSGDAFPAERGELAVRPVADEQKGILRDDATKSRMARPSVSGGGAGSIVGTKPTTTSTMTSTTTTIATTTITMTIMTTTLITTSTTSRADNKTISLEFRNFNDFC